jgi:hypothetical protein
MGSVTLRYDGTTGAFLGEKPSLGTAPSVGAAVFSWMAPLHFGNFAGMLSRGLWAVLGIGCCLLTCSGLAVWSERRLEGANLSSSGASSRGAQAMRRILCGFAAGLPLASFAAVLAWAVAVALGVGPTGLMGAVGGLALAGAVLVAAIASPLRRVTAVVVAAAGLLACAAPLVATWATGSSSVAAWQRGHPGPAAVDLILFALGTGLLLASRALARPDPLARLSTGGARVVDATPLEEPGR